MLNIQQKTFELCIFLKKTSKMIAIKTCMYILNNQKSYVRRDYFII